MASYKIIGPCRVCERQPGETLTDKDLAVSGISVDHLIASGHLEETSTKRSSIAAVDTPEDQA
jgi:hypothetical protein